MKYKEACLVTQSKFHSVHVRQDLHVMRQARMVDVTPRYGLEGSRFGS
jgi:hypothetical protein